MTSGPPPSRTGGRGYTVAGRVLAVALCGLLVAVAVSPTGRVGSTAYLVGSVGGAATAWIGAKRRALRRGSIPWVSITLTLNAAADVVHQVTVAVTGSAAGSSADDLLRLAAYGTLSAMLLRSQLGGRRRPGTTLHALLDGTGALAVSLLAVWQTSAWSGLAAHGHDVAARLAWIGPPVLDALLLGLVGWRVVVHGTVRRAALLGLAGVLCWLVADVDRLAAETTGSSGWYLDVARLTGVLLLAAVPWTRSLPADRAEDLVRADHGPWRIALDMVPYTVPSALLLAGRLRGVAVDPVPDVAAYWLLLLLSSFRMRVIARDGERAWGTVRHNARRSEALAVNSSDAVAVVDADARLSADSASLARLLGTSAQAGDGLAALLAPLGISAAHLQTVLDDARHSPGSPVDFELEGCSEAGERRWLGGRAVDLRDDADVAGIIVSVYDITRRKLAEGELAHQAFHDGLTGLANRSLFLDRAEQALRRAGRTGTAPIVLCLDLDGFKDVNDSLGHLVGDALLREVGGRLLGAVRAGDTVARLGGDEFAVLVEDPVGGLSEATDLAERLVAVLAEPVRLDGHRVTVGASIGIVTAEPESTPLSLLQEGDIAMYRAKADGRGRWVAFAPEMRATALERIELERELAGALPSGQLRLVYQPVVDLRDDRVVGFEALLRWQHPTLGAVGPDRFVPVAEASGLIVPIGRWVLVEACSAAARWQRERPAGAPLTMSINVSPRQLASDTFLDDVADALAHSGLDPATVVLEITETALVTEPEAVGARLAALQRMGLRIALDDFGTGYSSLSYLREFPVDVLKIDRSFVSLLDGSAEDAAIVHGLVQLGRTLDLAVVAEGVESPGQRDQLRAERCHLAQGYLFSRPLEADQAARMLVAPARAALP